MPIARRRRQRQRSSVSMSLVAIALMFWPRLVHHWFVLSFASRYGSRSAGSTTTRLVCVFQGAEIKTRVIELDAGSAQFSEREISEEFAAIDVEAVGICGSDRHLIEKRIPADNGTVLGHEIVGRIAALPAGHRLVADWRVAVGDRVVIAPGVACGHCYNCLHHRVACSHRPVYGFDRWSGHPSGGLSRVMALRPKTRVFRIPDGLSVDRAVFIEPVACAESAVRRVERLVSVRDGAAAVILGFGPIGVAAATAIRARGAEVSVVEPAIARANIARELGFTVAKGSYEHHYGLAVDCVGRPGSLGAAARLVGVGGAVVEMGAFAPDTPSGLDAADVCLRNLSIVGSSETRYEDFYAAVRIVSDGPTPVHLAVTDRVNWGDLSDPDELFTDATLKRVVTMDGAQT